MESPVKEYLVQITVGTLQSYKNLALFPLLSSHSISLEYYLLDEALTEKVIDIVEVSKEGSVPSLNVVNKSPKLILILDGEELVGAKQNRVVNTTILLSALSTTVIPVSCVEQGRWSYRGEKFGSEERIMSANLRAMKAEQVNYSVKERGDFGSNQGEIWNAIEEKATRRGARSLSMAMANIYEKDRPSLEEYTTQFSLQEHQVGAVFLINGEVAGLDTFGKEETFIRIFKKLLESYALDAIDWFDPGKELKSEERDITTYLSDIISATMETRKSVALGTDIRLGSNKVTGFALVHEDQLLHLSVFLQKGQTKRNTQSTRMERFSSRRRRER